MLVLCLVYSPSPHLTGMPIFCYFLLFLARSVLHRSVSVILYFLLFHLSLSELCLFLCSFSVRRHAHVDFQLFPQKSSGIPGAGSVLSSTGPVCILTSSLPHTVSLMVLICASCTPHTVYMFIFKIQGNKMGGNTPNGFSGWRICSAIEASLPFDPKNSLINIKTSRRVPNEQIIFKMASKQQASSH